MGMWMDQVASGWLLYDLTRSPLQLGLLQGLQALPILFLSPIAGTAADRYDRKVQMMAALFIDVLLYSTIAGLIVTGQIQPWHVYVASLAAGSVSTFHQPARAAMIVDSVPKQHLSNAVGLTSVLFNVSRSIGPAIAGTLIALVGTAGSYFTEGALYALAAVVTSILPASLRFPNDRQEPTARRASFARSTIDGWKASWGNPSVRAALLVVTSAAVFIIPFTTLFPVFARDVLFVDARGQGLFLTAMGVGAFCSSIFVASIGDRIPRGMLMLGGVVLYGLTVIGFAASSWFPLSVALMVVVGVFHVTTHTLTQIVVQSYTPPELQGRTTSILQQVFVFQMLGGMILGSVALLAGAQWAVAIMAMIGILVAIAIFLSVPAARRIR